MRELFEFNFMQTDPNWSNFLYNPESKQVSDEKFFACLIFVKINVLEIAYVILHIVHRDQMFYRIIATRGKNPLFSIISFVVLNPNYFRDGIALRIFKNFHSL